MSNRPVVTVGNFDGVHLGHQQILGEARQLAAGAEVVAVTFDPHPAALLRPGTQPMSLTDVAERAWLLKRSGASRVVVLRADADLLRLAPEAFLRWLIETHVGGVPRALVEGPDFRFGRDRAGDAALLKTIGDQLGFETRVLPAVQMALIDQTVVPVSSSLIRWLIDQGRALDAARCLGRAHALEATVVTGEQRGRTIGVPTANLDDAALSGRQLPCDGVYAAAAEVEGEASLFAAALSIGVKPTFKGRCRVIEAHLLDFSGDLYGKKIRVHLLRWVRGQRPFPGIDALKAQIERDIALVRQWRDRGLLETGRVAARWAAKINHGDSIHA